MSPDGGSVLGGQMNDCLGGRRSAGATAENHISGDWSAAAPQERSQTSQEEKGARRLRNHNKDAIAGKFLHIPCEADRRQVRQQQISAAEPAAAVVRAGVEASHSDRRPV